VNRIKINDVTEVTAANLLITELLNTELLITELSPKILTISFTKQWFQVLRYSL
jgi:hypothetical protein